MKICGKVKTETIIRESSISTITVVSPEKF